MRSIPSAESSRAIGPSSPGFREAGASIPIRSIVEKSLPAGSMESRPPSSGLPERGSICRLQRPVESAPAVAMASLAGGGGLAPRSGFQPREDKDSPLTPWLIGLAIAASVAELLLRRRSNAARIPPLAEAP